MAAQLPRFQGANEVPASIGGRAVRPGDTKAGGVARVLGAAGQAANQLAGEVDRIQATKESAWITRATGEAGVFAADLERRLEAEAGEGAEGHVDRFRTEWGAYQGAITGAAPSSRARSALTARLDGIGFGAINRRGAFQARAELAKREMDFRAGVGAQIEAARANPERLNTILPTIADDVEASIEWLPAASGSDDPIGFTEAFAASSAVDAMEAAARGFADKGDMDSARTLADNMRGMDEARAQEVDYELNRIETEEIRAEDDFDDARLQQMTEASGFDIVARGELTPDWIDVNGGSMSEQAEKDFRQSLRVKAAETLPNVYADLLAKPSEPGAMNEALGALANGTLTHDDFQKLYAASRVAGPALKFREQIVKTLRPAQFDDARAYVDALGEFDEFAATNPEATREELRGKADEIISTGKTRASDDLRATMPIPIYVPNARGAITLDATKKAAKSLIGAFRAGKMQPGDFTAEAKKLRDWVELLESQNDR